VTERPGAQGPPIGKTAARVVHAFSEAFFAERPTVLPAKQIAENALGHLERLPHDVRRELGTGLVLFDYASVLVRGRRFSSLPLHTRMDAIDFVRRRLKLLDPVADALKAAVVAGYYGDPSVQHRLGFSRPADRPAPARRGRFRHERTIAVHAPQGPKMCADVCVVGSGAAGSVVAWHAAASGRQVVVVEEGPYFPPSRISHNEAEMAASLYRRGGVQPTRGFEVNVLQGRCVGGSTTINNGICFRIGDESLLKSPHRDVAALWRERGATLNEARLERSFERVSARMRVHELDPSVVGRNAALLLDGWEKWTPKKGKPPGRAGYFKTNFVDCLGCGMCNYGCSYGRRISANEAFLAEAVELGARLVPNCEALALERGSGVVGVKCNLAGRPFLVRARTVIVAGGAIASSAFLLRSGIRRNVGRGLSFNVAARVFARFPHDVDAFDEVPMGSFVDLGTHMLESIFYPPVGAGVAMPGWFGAHFDRMSTYRRMAAGAVLVGTQGRGTMRLRRFPGRPRRVAVTANLEKHDLDRLVEGVRALAQIYLAAGAEVVFPSIRCDLALRSTSDVDRVNRALVKFPRDLMLTSAHPQGGNAMSDDPASGVVDGTFRVHGVPNVWVCDASVFPASLGFNPQLTVMALADYFGGLTFA
jgi:choline dehydrogenase-like flavoprotein